MAASSAGQLLSRSCTPATCSRLHSASSSACSACAASRTCAHSAAQVACRWTWLACSSCRRCSEASNSRRSESSSPVALARRSSAEDRAKRSWAICFSSVETMEKCSFCFCSDSRLASATDCFSCLLESTRRSICWVDSSVEDLNNLRAVASSSADASSADSCSRKQTSASSNFVLTARISLSLFLRRSDWSFTCLWRSALSLLCSSSTAAAAPATSSSSSTRAFVAA